MPPPNLNFANILLRSVWGQTTKFTDHQHFSYTVHVYIQVLECEAKLQVILIPRLLPVTEKMEPRNVQFFQLDSHDFAVLETRVGV